MAWRKVERPIKLNFQGERKTRRSKVFQAVVRALMEGKRVPLGGILRFEKSPVEEMTLEL